jgi:hypothetical protein
VPWQYYTLPLLASTVRHHALLLKTYLCHTQSHTQALLILSTLVRSILVSASQCSFHVDVDCAQTLLYSLFEWKHSVTPCSASQDSLVPYSGCLDTQFFEYVVSWLVYLNAVSIRCKLCSDSTTLSLWVKACSASQDSLMPYSEPYSGCFDSQYFKYISFLASASQCCVHEGESCALIVLRSLLAWKHSAPPSSAFQDALMPYDSTTLSPCLKAQCDTILCILRRTNAILNCLDAQNFAVSWLVHHNAVSMQVKAVPWQYYFFPLIESMLCFSRHTYAILRAILRLSWYSKVCVRSTLASASQYSLHEGVSCALTELHSPFAWKHSATRCSASSDSLMPYSGCLDAQYIEYIVPWLVHLNTVSMQMTAVPWYYYTLPLIECTVRHHALLLKTHLCHTQAVLILNTLST